MSGLKLQPAKHTRLFEQAVDQIKELIMEGELLPGDRLPSESDLSKVLDVSRSSIREALRALESQGVIEVRTGSGAFVTEHPFSFDSVGAAVTWLSRRRDSLVPILQVRQVLEGLTARLAAIHGSADQLDELGRLVAEQEVLMQPPDEADLNRLAQLDVQFHQLIAAAAGNPLAQQLINAIVTSFSQSNKIIIYVGKGAFRTLADHQAIAAAIRSRDADGAEQAIRAHIARVAQELGDLHA